MTVVRGAYLPRHLDRALARAVAAFPVVVLDGPRGAGKTTSARRLAASAVNLPDDLERLRVDPSGFLGSLAPPVLVDEWQLAGTDVLWTVKRLVDDDPTPGRFLLTGGVEPATYGPTYPLTGRAAHLALRPMTMSEQDGAGGGPTFLERVVRGEQPQPTSGGSRQFTLEWLSRAGFPAAMATAEPKLFLEGYAAIVAQRAGQGRDASRLLKTLRVLATLEARAVPDQRIWEAADINKATWKAYDDLLTRTHLVTPSPPFESNRLKRLTGYPKRFLADVALALALAEVDTRRLEHDPSLAGRYVESFVIQQLRPQVDAVGGTLCHLRTGAGEREVDAVVEIGDQIVAFEVKHSTQPRQPDTTTLAWLRDQFPGRFLAGYVVHTGGDAFTLGDRLWAVPIHVLAGRGLGADIPQPAGETSTQAVK